MVTTHKRHPKKRYFKRTIALITITVITFILITSFSIYGFTKQAIIQDKYQTDSQMLSQIKHVIEKDNQAVRKICMELFYNESSAAIMNTDWSGKSLAAVKNNLHKVESTTLALNPFIHSIYFYNSVTKQYYTTHYGNDIAVKDVFLINTLNQHSTVPVLQPLLRKINLSDMRDRITEHVFSYVMCSDMTGYNGVDSAIIVNIKLDYFLDEIKDKAMSNRQSGDFFALITQDGTWFPDREYTDNSSFVDYLTGIFLSKITVLFHQGSKLGIITESIQGEDYFISFISIGGTSLSIIKAQPYEMVFRHLTETANRITIVTTLAVLASIFVSLLLSWRIYVPIRRLMNIVDENNFMEQPDELQNNDEVDFLRGVYLYTMRELKEAASNRLVVTDLRRQNFMIQLFKGTVSRDEAQKAMSDKLIQTSLFDPFYLWIIKIDNYARLLEMSSRDYNLSKYGIGNIMNEVISRSYPCDLFELEPDRFCVLLSCPDGDNNDGREDIYNRFEEAAAEGQNAVLRYLELYISVSFSERINDYTSLSKQYAITDQNMRYRVIYGKMCAINPKMVEGNNLVKPYEYPFCMENNLLSEIKNGNLPEAESCLDALIHEIEKKDYNSIIISILRLYNMVYDTLTEIYENSFVPIPESLDIIGVNYLEQYTIADVKAKIWQETVNTLEAVKDSSGMGKRNMLVNTISVLIMSNFHNPSFCITSVSEMLDKTPNYIGSLYKEATGKSIAQHILDTRLKRAEELLLTTDYTIGKIIELTGFVNESGFYKNFKRYYGMTPSNYKLKQKLESSITSVTPDTTGLKPDSILGNKY